MWWRKMQWREISVDSISVFKAYILISDYLFNPSGVETEMIRDLSQ